MANDSKAAARAEERKDRRVHGIMAVSGTGVMDRRWRNDTAIFDDGKSSAAVFLPFQPGIPDGFPSGFAGSEVRL
jgi:hypothetical protein